MEGNNDTVNVKPEIMVNPSIISKPVSAENTVENVKPVAGIIEMNSMLFSIANNVATAVPAISDFDAISLLYSNR